MLAERWSGSGAVTRLFFLAALSVNCLAMLSGCAPMVSSKDELQSVGENEGVVFGSFVINVEKGQESESGWAFLKGQKAGDATYSVMISEQGFNPLSPNYIIRATPEKEETFIRKLPAGAYQIKKIQKEGFTNLELNVRVNFTVAPKQTTYLGKLTVLFPDRIRVGSPVRMNVTDAQRESTELLKNEHENSLSNAVKALMAVQR
jgi:hypothetical protein